MNFTGNSYVGMNLKDNSHQIWSRVMYYIMHILTRCFTQRFSLHIWQCTKLYKKLNFGGVFLIFHFYLRYPHIILYQHTLGYTKYINCCTCGYAWKLGTEKCVFLNTLTMYIVLIHPTHVATFWRGWLLRNFYTVTSIDNRVNLLYLWSLALFSGSPPSG